MSDDRSYNSYQSHWNSQAYLQQYYCADRVAGDVEVYYQKVISFLKRSGKQYQQMIDVGCGPTIHMVIPIAPWVKEIHLADFNQENLDEVKKWLNEETNAHNWDLYINRVLEIETGANVTNEMIDARKNILREKITKLVLLDIASPENIKSLPKFDLVLSAYCVDAATSKLGEWKKLLNNLTTIASNDSTLVLVSSNNSTYYAVREMKFPNAGVSQNEIIDALEELGYTLKTTNEAIDQQFHLINVEDWVEYGISSIILAIISRSA